MIGLKRPHALGGDILEELLGPWAAGAAPLNEQLAAAIQQAIDRGDLAPGTRLPSERELAAALGLSRTTVVLAYDRLRGAGRIISRQGSGTRVALPRQFRGHAPGAALAEPLLGDLEAARRIVAGAGPPARARAVDPNRIELTIGALRGTGRIQEAAILAASEDLPALLDDFGYQTMGIPPLREAVADLFGGMGVPTDPDQIIITSGAQQAVDLVARELVGPDGSAAIENPTYLGAIDALRAVGARMIPCAVDDEGLRTDLARAAVTSAGPRIIYTIPTFQNPTGVVMPESRRRELAELASATGTLIVEDLTTDHRLGKDVPPPIAAWDEAETVVSLGSMSKVGWGGLRVGWMRLPHGLVPRMLARKAIADHGSSVISQAVARRLLLDRDATVAEGVRAADERREVMLDALARHLPEWTPTAPRGGLSIWVRLPGVDAARFSRVAAEHGVVVRPGSLFSPDGGYRDHLRIAVGDDPARLREAVERLARAWAIDRGSIRRQPQDVAVDI